jgi:hypothetical protein
MRLIREYLNFKISIISLLASYSVVFKNNLSSIRMIDQDQ